MMPSAPARPNPDALLKQARREGRGKLKVFLGASPGVGKTYEMLSEAGALKRGGRDVVIGVVETHGRQETVALLGDLEQVPARTVEYHGRTLHEMDLDAVLARKPGLVLVDELAHTNIPGSRHPKRWQDVEELLAAGIDVFSTVNIQHLESLNDTVTSFTRVRVRETVPDSVLEQAELEIVDIPPDELIERLKEGKVYVPEEASRALGHFFSRSNLAALRELTLRQGAQAVDARMLDDLDAEAAQGTWAAGERVLVAVSELPGCEALVRAAKRLADSQRAKWTALHIETPRSATFDGAQRKQVAGVLQLAGELGATVASLPATSVLEGLKTYAAQHRITQVVVGKSNRSRWFELRHGSVVDRLVRDTPGIHLRRAARRRGCNQPPREQPAQPHRHCPAKCAGECGAGGVRPEAVGSRHCEGNRGCSSRGDRDRLRCTNHLLAKRLEGPCSGAGCPAAGTQRHRHRGCRVGRSTRPARRDRNTDADGLGLAFPAAQGRPDDTGCRRRDISHRRNPDPRRSDAAPSRPSRPGDTGA